MPNSENDYCYEYLACKEFDCVRRNNLSKNCWDIDDVECRSHSQDFEDLKKRLGNKLEACQRCIYYQSQN